MTLSGRTPTGADTAGHVPEIWSQQTIDEAEKELVAWDATDHSWQKDLVKGDTVNIGLINNVDATEVVVGTKAASLDIATGSKLQLIMDQWFEAPIDVDTMTVKQSQTNWATKARGKAAESIRRKVDSTVCALYSSLNTSIGVKGVDGDEITDDLLLELKEILLEADIPMDNDLFLIFDPSGLTDMLKYDKFVAAQYVAIGAVNNGQIGKTPIYGCNVRVTNNLTAATTGAYAAMVHRSAIASALQIESPWTKDFEELHQVRFQHEALWGVLEVRDTFGICFFTRKA